MQQLVPVQKSPKSSQHVAALHADTRAAVSGKPAMPHKSFFLSPASKPVAVVDVFKNWFHVYLDFGLTDEEALGLLQITVREHNIDPKEAFAFYSNRLPDK